MVRGNPRAGGRGLLVCATAAGLMLGSPAPTTADDVDITASTNAGVNLNNFAGTTTRVLPGVTVGNNSTLMPNNSFPAIFASTQGWTLTNQGTIDGLSGNAITFNAGGTVNNESQVLDGILFGAGGTINNAAGAIIQDSQNAIVINGSAGTVTNWGDITSIGSTTVVLSAGGTVTNHAGAAIVATNSCCNALSIYGGTSRNVVNHGRISATFDTFDAGVVISGGTVTNTGQIEGRYNAIWAITVNGASTIINSGTLRATNPTTGGGGIEMQVGGTVENSGTIEGTLGIDVTGGATTVINSGIITGSGGIAIRFAGGADTLTLLPTSVITGSINGAAGSDVLNLDGASGTTGAFNVNTNVVTNFESANKTGAGTWNLTGNSGAFIPAVDVQQGRLNVNGALTALDLTVRSGATVGGSGTADILNVLAGGTVAPGNSIGTMTVATATLAPGSVMEVELNPTISDRLDVTGTATINAGSAVHVVPAAAGNYAVGTEYLILAAGTRIGAFTGLTDSSAFLEFVLDHTKDPNEVWLRLASVTNFPAVAKTPNQVAAAQALQALGLNSPLGTFVAPLSTADALVAFDQLSGEIHASAARALLEDGRIPREAALDRVAAAFEAIERLRDEEWGRSLWGRFIGAAGVVKGDGNAASIDYGTVGLVVGADGLIGDDILLGFEAGVTQHGLSVPARSSTATVTGYHLGVYGGTALDGFRIKGGASVSAYGIDAVRRPTFQGFTDTLHAGYGVLISQVFVEFSYVFETDAGSVEPFVRLAALNHAASGYAETGGIAALAGNVNDNSSAIVALGLHGSMEVTLGEDMVVKVKGTIGWEHHFGSTPTATHAFAGGLPFTVAAAGFGSGPVAELGTSIALSQTTSLDVSLKGGIRSSGTYGSVLATFAGTF